MAFIKKDDGMLLLQKRCLLSQLLLVTLTFAFTQVSLGDEELIVPPADAPMYRLSNLRIDDAQILVFDFKRTRAGKPKNAYVQLGGKSKNATLQVHGNFPSDQSGTFRLQIRIGARGKDYELYLKTPAPLGKSYLVSNVIRVGNPGTRSRARAFTAKENEAIAKAKLAATPPASIPDDFQAVDASTELVAGMPIKAGRDAKWQDAEVLSFEEGGKVSVKFLDTAKLKQVARKDWLAVSPAVLREARRDPGKFKPSVIVLQGGGLLEIPAGSIPLPKSVTFPKGTPLQLEYHHHKWHDVFVIKDNGDTILLRYKGYGANWDKSKNRNEFVVAEKTLEELKSPEKVKAFAANVSGDEPSFPSSGEKKTKIKHKRYKVSIDVPKRAKFVPDDVIVEKGTPLAACYARKWNPITALSENEDGSLHVRWDDYGEAFDCNMLRSELVIENKTLAKLKKKSESADMAEAVDLAKLKSEFRTWTDSSGKHKIEAVYDSHTDSDVTLESKAGKVITMPLDKLGKQDQELISKIPDEVENPFETFAK